MARKKKHAAHANHERWLVSYADFITLMFAFFVVMFAASQADKGKAKQVAESVRKALEEGQFAAAIAGILGGAAEEKGKGNAMMRGPGGTLKNPKETPQAELVELLPSLEYLKGQLQPEIQSGKIQISLEPRGLVVSMKQAAFFPSGEDTIDPQTYPSIGKVATAVRKLPNPVRLEGHTDSVPIHNARFRSNWELSAARSIAMLELLTGRFEIPPERLAIAGYAETAPMESNETEEGRARNRRVDIVILNQHGRRSEPPVAGQNRAGPAADEAPGHKKQSD